MLSIGQHAALEFAPTLLPFDPAMNLQSFHLHARNLTAITTSIPLNATSYSCGQCATRAVAGLFSAMLGQRESQCLLPMQPLSKDLHS